MNVGFLEPTQCLLMARSRRALIEARGQPIDEMARLGRTRLRFRPARISKYYDAARRENGETDGQPVMVLHQPGAPAPTTAR